jgi:hypothetical protein
MRPQSAAGRHELYFAGPSYFGVMSVISRGGGSLTFTRAPKPE